MSTAMSAAPPPPREPPPPEPPRLYFGAGTGSLVIGAWPVGRRHESVADRSRRLLDIRVA